MSHLAPLIADLALILICAGIMTLLFTKLKQPLVLGYVVAGFLASPHMAYTPSVMDTANIQTWADIGVIFLLFALGLEFSFKKIVKVGGAAIIAACTIIFCMILLGVAVGTGFGWKRMDCIFLGGMIAMSSTTIIYKAFDDLGMRKKQFTGLVLSVLILEDILAIVLMVMLSTMAVSHNFEGTEMLESIAKLLFFLILWFVVGIYLIPGLLKRCRKLMSEETLLIVSLGLCFGMVVMAAHTGFSAAFGAFIMGSILAETVEAESIERLVKPVKDLFGAIFFVSVGMMVDPAMIVEYAGPIVVITLAVIFGQSLFGTLGVLLAGEPLKTAMQCGFSLTQIGEFAFIIASLGVSLHVTSHFLYPIVVAVSVITTFLTPYMIRLSDPVYCFADRHLPQFLKDYLTHYSSGTMTTRHQGSWHKLIRSMLVSVTLYLVVCLFFIALFFSYAYPLVMGRIPGMKGSLLSFVLVLLIISPFLCAIIMKKNNSVEFRKLWADNRFNRGLLVSMIVIKVLICIIIVMGIIIRLFNVALGSGLILSFLIIVVIYFSKRIRKRSLSMEKQFLENFQGTAGTFPQEEPETGETSTEKNHELSNK